jgi:hypothetical protein
MKRRISYNKKFTFLNKFHGILTRVLKVFRLAQLVIQRAGSYSKIHKNLMKFKMLQFYTILYRRYLLVVELFLLKS